MVYFLIGIAYVLLLAMLVRFFQAVHRWDDEITLMGLNANAEREQKANAKAA